MMNNTFLILLLTFFMNVAVAEEAPYVVPDNSFVDRGETVVVTPMTPIKSQDGIGLCYGFSATSLLENYRCRELNVDCSDPNEFLSSLDVTSYYGRERLIEGGNTQRILMNLEKGKKIAREECIRFSTLVHQVAVTQNSFYRDERQGWNFLTKKWNEFKGYGGEKRNDCASCLADAIKSTLVNIQTPADQLKNAFTEAHTLEEFLYKALLPLQCMNDAKMAAVPPFVTKSYPGYNEKSTDEAIKAKVETVLRNNIPLEMGICTSVERPCQEGAGHSIAIMGIKEVCSQSTGECKKLVKVKNSYGNSWQANNNDGWLELDSLVEASRALSPYGSLTWIQKPGFVLQENKNKEPKKISSPTRPTRPPSGPSGPSGVPSEYKNYKGVWKCPNATFMDHYEPGCVPMGR